MTLVKTFPTPVKASPICKIPASSLTGKSSPITKKPVDVIPLKKPTAPASPIKMKTTSMLTKSPIQAEKSPSKVEKSPTKSTGTKPSVTSTMKTASPALKSPVAETKTPIRNAIKPITTLKTPEQKSLGAPKKATPLPVSKTSVNSAPALKTPTKPNPMVKNISSPKSPSSPVKSISSPVKSPSSPVKSISSPVKSPSSPVKSISSPVKSPSSPVRSFSSPVKSASSSIKSISSPIKSASTSVKSISSPVKSASSSSTKSISSPIKSASSSIKSISSPIKSASPLIKSISSPLKPKTTGEVKPSSPEKTKDVKTNQITSSISVKKPTSILKSPLKTSNKIDSSSKLKPSIKISPISKMVKNVSITTKTVSKQPTIAESNSTEVSSDLSSSVVEQVNLCQCIDTIENCQEFTNTPLITEYTIDNEDSNFDVVQAIKVAQQLIQIQSSDRNLETIIETCESTSMVNWDDVITPCDEIITISTSSNQNELPHSQQNDDSIPCDNSENPISIHDSCIVEIEGLHNPTCDSEKSNVVSNEQNDEFVVSLNHDDEFVVPLNHDDKFVVPLNHDENHNLIELTDLNDPLPIRSESTEIGSTDEQHFTDDLLSTNTDDSIQNQCDKNQFPEWTITIDEFSINTDKEENQPTNIDEIVADKETHVADQTPCTVNLSYADALKKVDVVSYADILKKTPKVLGNSTNVVSCKKEPRIRADTRIKKYQRLQKVDSVYSSDESINNIENNYQDYDYDFYEEPMYPEMRKKKCKKIKYASKRHPKNINLEYDCIENHIDVFVTSVWKNIYEY